MKQCVKNPILTGTKNNIDDIKLFLLSLNNIVTLLVNQKKFKIVNNI